MNKNFFLPAFFIVVFVAFCFAADLGGKWVGTMITPDGSEFPVAYNLKVEGEKLSGIVAIPDAELEIQEGKIEGENFSFTVSHDGSSYLNEGKLMGDSLKVKVHFGDAIIERVLKREK
jgi:hypothetical protein